MYIYCRYRFTTITQALRPVENFQPSFWNFCGRGVKLTTHPHLVPRSRMSRSYTSFPPQAPPWRVAWLLYFYLFFFFFYISDWEKIPQATFVALVTAALEAACFSETSVPTYTQPRMPPLVHKRYDPEEFSVQPSNFRLLFGCISNASVMINYGYNFNSSAS
jgi:hypothetical protein